jgi:large subunit ribosomal protein L26e
MPVRKGDTVKVVRGTSKNREGKIMTVYRKKWCIHIEKITREKSNGKCFSLTSAGTQTQIPIHPSNCVVTALKLDKNRKAILEKKRRVVKDKNKHKEGMTGLD